MRTIWPLYAVCILILFALLSFGCKASSTEVLLDVTPTSVPVTATNPEETIIPSSTPGQPRQLTICLAQEPVSLFLYADHSIAARTVREALYDGPYDLVDYEYQPVILEKKPSLSDGDVLFQPVAVNPGDLLIDADQNLTNLGEGVDYFPSGCFSIDCVQTYTGQDPVQVDRLVVRFKLRQGIQWADGKPLTADDSLFSYETAQALYPGVRPELLTRTHLYQVLDSYTLEWQGVPGYWPSSAVTFFFDPIPRHTWGDLPINELLESELVNRQPLGYGPYKFDDWLSGDRINLSRNPGYFRAREGLPRFDTLVFRFVPDVQEALDLLEKGECDLLDETYRLETKGELLDTMKDLDQIVIATKDATAWEHIDFGLLPSAQTTEPGSVGLSSRGFRQALAQCIDRQRIVDTLFGGEVVVLNQYIPANHPLANPDLFPAGFDPQAATATLEELGWLDADGIPTTPRIAQGIPGLNDGEVLELSMLSANDSDSLLVAQIIQESLAQCGVSLKIEAVPAEELFLSGPEGPLFGRQFQLAKFAWQASPEPPCHLYLTAQIPGNYPQFPLGWGGANASGYTNQDYDRWCSLALSILPNEQQIVDANRQIQAMLAQDLPFLPLYSHRQILATRRDLCGLLPDAPTRSSLWNLEKFDIGKNCGENP